MYTKDGKVYYEWSDYNEDIDAILRTININCAEDPSDFSKGYRKDTNIVGVYRGSLGLAGHISNVLDLDMSVVQYQTRDGADEYPSLVINKIKDEQPIVLIDDICDSGKTMSDLSMFLKKEYPNNYLLRICIFGNKETGSISLYVREHDGSWIVFPWERNGD